MSIDALLLSLQPLFAPAWTVWGADITWLELVAALLAVAMVVFNIRVDPLGWPLAIVSALLYVLLFWRSRLYGEAALQLFFVVLASWGWWQWLRGTAADGGALRVRALGVRGRWRALAAFGIAWPLTGALLARYTDTDVPWWDAFPTAGSIVGQWLLGRKYIETWVAWIAVNSVGAALFAYKELWLTALLYAAFIGMSLAGWRAWRRLAGNR